MNRGQNVFRHRDIFSFPVPMGPGEVDIERKDNGSRITCDNFIISQHSGCCDRFRVVGSGKKDIETMTFENEKSEKMKTEYNPTVSGS